jgi:hypothetical protein
VQVVATVIPDHRLQLYLIVYAVFRILTEFLRPELVYAFGLTWYQWAAMVLGVGLTGQWIWEAGLVSGSVKSIETVTTTREAAGLQVFPKSEVS